MLFEGPDVLIFVFLPEFRFMNRHFAIFKISESDSNLSRQENSTLCRIGDRVIEDIFDGTGVSPDCAFRNFSSFAYSMEEYSEVLLAFLNEGGGTKELSIIWFIISINSPG